MVPSHRLGPARRFVAALGALLAACSLALVVQAAGADVAFVTRTADRVVQPVGDLVVVFDIGDVDQDVVLASHRVAAASGAVATPARTGSLGMRSITRDGAVVHAAPPGYLIPVVYTSLPRASIGQVMGSEVSGRLGPGKVVMNEMTAGITGARAGDVIVMQSASGAPVPLTISSIEPYDTVGSAELVFTYEVAVALGATADTRMVIFDVDRARVDAAIAAEGLEQRAGTRVSRSWDAPDPDSTLSTARTKLLLGEPVYRFESDGSISMHPDWIATNLRPSREVLDASIPIRARCHVRVVDDLRAALADVAAAGLAGAIDVANANTYGGCYAGARYSRVSGEIGFLSRHSYGMALDTNTTSNCQGCRPQMDCGVVRIFRRHGFAWGGNFRLADGMHFEWVGEPRDHISYPSDFCPNVVPAADEPDGSGASAPEPTLGRDVLTVGDGAMDIDHHATP